MRLEVKLQIVGFHINIFEKNKVLIFVQKKNFKKSSKIKKIGKNSRLHFIKNR